MTRHKHKYVSNIVEEYLKKYPTAERKLLKDAILRKNPEINVRTLNRHLKKAFSTKPLQSRTNTKSIIMPTSLWDRTQEKLLQAGLPLIDIQLEKLRLGDEDPITGIPKIIFDVVVPIKGYLILQGAIEVQKAVSISVPDRYLGFVLTKGEIKEGDRIVWRNNKYEIQEVQDVIEGIDLSYRIGKLVYPHQAFYSGIRFHPYG